MTAAASERLAALAQKRGKPADAERLWRSALEIRTELAQLETQNVPAQAAFALAFAHAGRRDEATEEGRGADEDQRGSTGRLALAGAVLRRLRGWREERRRSPRGVAVRLMPSARRFATATAILSRSGPSLTSRRFVRIRRSENWLTTSSPDCLSGGCNPPETA